MDPLAAFTLAGTILQFVTASIQVISVANAIKSSKDGNILSNAALDDKAERISILRADLQDTHVKRSPAIEPICARCITQAKDVQDLLEMLRQYGGQGPVGRARKAILMQWESGRLAKLEKTLKKTQDELLMHLVASVYGDQTKLISLVESLSTLARETFAQSKEDSLETREVLLDQLRQLRTPAKTHASPALGDLSAESLRDTVIAALTFPSMQERYHNVIDAHHGSFEWILEQKHNDIDVGFGQWLSSKSGIF